MNKVSGMFADGGEFAHLRCEKGWLGASCGDGWAGLVQELTITLQQLGTCCIVQIKEKFGTMRYYAIIRDQHLPLRREMMLSVIDCAEAMSQSICEYCGMPGTLRPERHWMKTLCDECLEKCDG